jgi:hypothetical protein
MSRGKIVFEKVQNYGTFDERKKRMDFIRLEAFTKW